MDNIGPALGFLEVGSIARGVVATDVMVKKAPIVLLKSQAICPGKYIILIGGKVADVEESLKAGVYYAGNNLIDQMFLPNAHFKIFPAILGTGEIEEIDSVGIVELFSTASTVLAADAALKAAEVDVIEIRLAVGIGGKGFFILTGKLEEVEAAVEAAKNITKSGLLVSTEIIPAPHLEVHNFLG